MESPKSIQGWHRSDWRRVEVSKITVYNKAIRDKIPQIIEESGSKCECQVLSDEEFLPYLEDKLHEEIGEYDATKSMMELVDVIEIIFSCLFTW